MKTKSTKSEPPAASMAGNDSVMALHGSMAARRIIAVDNSKGKSEVHHHGYKLADLIDMLEERFQHLLQKDLQIEEIWQENRILTAEVIGQSQELRRYNLAYKEQADRIDALTLRITELTDKLLAK